MKRIIIFGATGSIGVYLVDFLNQQGFEVIAVGRRNIPVDYYKERNMQYVQLDITNKEQLNKLPQDDVFAVVLLSATMPARMEGYKPYDYLNNNIFGAWNVLEYCRKSKVDRVLYTQTESDYAGYWATGVPLKPDMPRKINFTGDHAIYAISKSTAVDLTEHYHQEYGLKNFIFRLPTIYCYTPDPYYYVDGKKQMMAYRYLINQAIVGKPIEMWGDPLKAKDIVYVKDACQMFYKAILSNRETGFYNIGTGKGVTLEDQIKGIIEVFSPKNNPSKIIPCPEKKDSRAVVYDIEKARRELGYKPQYDYIGYLKDFKLEMELKRFDTLLGGVT